MGGKAVTSQIRGAAMLARVVMGLWWYLGFLALSEERCQLRLKKRYGRLVILPGATWWGWCSEKVGTVLSRGPVDGFTFGGEQISLRLARQRWWCTRHGRHERHTVFIVEKQFVIHLETHHQNTDVGSIIEGGGDQIADPYKRIGARSERANLRQK